MTIREASDAFGVALVSEYEPQEDCNYVAPKRGFEGLSFMVIGDRIARVDVESNTYATPSGARVGDTEERIKALSLFDVKAALDEGIASRPPEGW